jgi:kinetochore protein NDC80
MVARLNLLDREITNDDSRCTADARRMKNELEKKYNDLSSVEKEADEFLKVLFVFVLFHTKDVFLISLHS